MEKEPGTKNPEIKENEESRTCKKQEQKAKPDLSIFIEKWENELAVLLKDKSFRTTSRIRYVDSEDAELSLDKIMKEIISDNLKHSTFSDDNLKTYLMNLEEKLEELTRQKYDTLKSIHGSSYGYTRHSAEFRYRILAKYYDLDTIARLRIIESYEQTLIAFRNLATNVVHKSQISNNDRYTDSNADWITKISESYSVLFPYRFDGYEILFELVPEEIWDKMVLHLRSQNKNRLAEEVSNLSEIVNDTKNQGKYTLTRQESAPHAQYLVDTWNRRYLSNARLQYLLGNEHDVDKVLPLEAFKALTEDFVERYNDTNNTNWEAKPNTGSTYLVANSSQILRYPVEIKAISPFTPRILQNYLLCTAIPAMIATTPYSIQTPRAAQAANVLQAIISNHLKTDKEGTSLEQYAISNNKVRDIAVALAFMDNPFTGTDVLDIIESYLKATNAKEQNPTKLAHIQRLFAGSIIVRGDKNYPADISVMQADEAKYISSALLARSFIRLLNDDDIAIRIVAKAVLESLRHTLFDITSIYELEIVLTKNGNNFSARDISRFMKKVTGNVPSFII
jgi:hypothetical protein